MDKVKEVKLVKYRQGRHSGSGRGHHGFRQRQFSLGWVGRWTDYDTGCPRKNFLLGLGIL